ncbi:MAG TPA: ScpA family protein [Candidatus Dormibacteraeota bacterium]|nr:ScpA family protein [Candidatus Dormibacteraeota bacterium]
MTIGLPIRVEPDGAAAPLAVRLEAGRRPEVAAHVRLEGWEGPLGLLLSLIEARQLDVLTVPLGSLAEAYLDALASIPGDRIGHVSAFVAVAGQLILIKSRALLPRQPAASVATVPAEDADPEADLRARLLRYRAFRDAGQRLEAIALERVGLFHREPGLAHAAGLSGAVAADAPPLDPAGLAGSLEAVLRVVPPPPPPPETVRRVVTLEERADLIRAALRRADTVVLQHLLGGVRDRVLIAVTFLAMLELVKRREIVVEQDGPWAPIVARAATGEERLVAGVAIDVVAEPLDETLGSFA